MDRRDVIPRNGKHRQQGEGRRQKPYLTAVLDAVAKDERLAQEWQLQLLREIDKLESQLWHSLLGNHFVARPVRNRLSSELKGKDKSQLHQLARQLTESTGCAGDHMLDMIRAVDVDRKLLAVACDEAINSCRPQNGQDTEQGKLAIQIKEKAQLLGVARQSVVKANMPLVRSIARRYPRRQLQYADLVQEGYLGLIGAVNRFDPRRGQKFSTYATPWIRATIANALARCGYSVRFSRKALSTWIQLSQADRWFRTRTGKPPTDSELARWTGLPTEHVSRASKARLLPALSLEEQISETDTRHRVDMLLDEEAEGAFDVSAARLSYQSLKGLFSRLTHREREVLLCRYGLDGREEMTLQELGDCFGLTRERVRQIQDEALSKLQQQLILT